MAGRDLWSQALYADVDAKLAVTALKAKFVQNAEALLHGDLHTGGPWYAQ